MKKTGEERQSASRADLVPGTGSAARASLREKTYTGRKGKGLSSRKSDLGTTTLLFLGDEVGRRKALELTTGGKK